MYIRDGGNLQGYYRGVEGLGRPLGLRGLAGWLAVLRENIACCCCKAALRCSFGP